MPRYSMVIRWSDEDRVYIVSFPEFGDHAHTHGKTYKQAAKHGRIVLRLLVETFQDEGWPLPEPRQFA